QRRRGQREATVSQDHIGFPCAILQISEVARIASNLLDGGINFVEGPPLARLGIASHRASAQANDGNLLAGQFFIERGEYLPERPGLVKIAQWLFLAGRISALQAVQGRAMIEQVIILRVKINDPVHTEKTAPGVEQAPSPTHVNHTRQHNRPNPQTKAERPPNKI